MRTTFCFLLSAFCFSAAAQFHDPVSVANMTTPIPSPTGPAFVREDMRAYATQSEATSVVDIQSDITTGRRAVLVVGWVSPSQVITNVTDSDGNTWSQDATNIFNTTSHQVIYSTVCAATLSAADSITIAWGSPAYTYRSWALFEVKNTSALDVTATGIGTGTTVSASASTTAPTAIIGLSGIASSVSTYSNSSFSSSGTNQIWANGNLKSYFLYSNSSSSGSKNIGGTNSSVLNWGAVWAAYK